MFQKQSGGLGALLDLFKQKGLASIASTWPGGDKGLPLGINPSPSLSLFRRFDLPTLRKPAWMLGLLEKVKCCAIIVCNK